MKQTVRSIFVLFSLLLSQLAHAQDILKLKNGDELKVKIQEITPQEIKYKRFDNLDGPLITIYKNTAQSIRYENGSIEKWPEEAPANPTTPYVNPGTPGLQTADLPGTTGADVGDIVSVDDNGTTYQGKIISVNRSRLTAVIDLDKNGKRKRVTRPIYEVSVVEKAMPAPGVPVSSYVVTNPDNSAGQVISLNAPDLFAKGQVDAKRYYDGYHGAGTGTFLTAFLLGPILGLIPAAACSSTAPSQDRLGLPNGQLARNSSYYTGYAQEAKRIKSRKVWSNFGIGSGLAIVLVLVAAAR